MIDVTHRRRLVALLTEAAELEHALMCQYLYAAFSMKRQVDEGVTLAAAGADAPLGGEHHADRPPGDGASRPGQQSADLDRRGAVADAPELPARARATTTSRSESKLERLTEETLVRFALFEIPDADIEGRTGAARQGAGPGDRPGALPDDRAPLRRDLAALQQLGEELFIGPPGAELATTDVIPVPLRGISLPNTARIYDVELVPVDGLASALAVVEQIVTEGEGSPGSSAESHFKRVLAILREFRTERERDPAFDPARPVTAHPDPHAIADRRTRRVSELFDDAYATLLLLLMRFFAHSDERTAELTGLQRAAFFPMMTTVIRPLGEMLTLLPTGPSGPAAPPARRSASPATSR